MSRDIVKKKKLFILNEISHVMNNKENVSIPSRNYHSLLPRHFILVCFHQLRHADRVKRTSILQNGRYVSHLYKLLVFIWGGGWVVQNYHL